VAGQTTVRVINSIAAGIASVGTGTLAEEGLIQGVSGHVDTQPVITVTEGYLNAFKPAGTGDTTSVVLRITLDKNPPAGVSVVFPLTASSSPGSGLWQLSSSSGSVTTSRTTITPTGSNLTAYYKIVTATDPTQLETVNITASDFLQISSTATFPLSASVVSYRVSLAPIGVAINSDGSFPPNIPRFAASDVGPAVLFTVVGSQTTLLIPLAQFVTFGTTNPVVYDTGISVANTTSDPGTTAMGGIATAVKQAGTITFYFFPQLATPSGTLPAMFQYTTKAGSPGTGLDASGNVPAGSTYTVLLSQLLTAAGATGSFQGYIFAVANFTNAHSLYVLSNFANFSQGSLALVILPTEGGRAGGNEALNN
jgi:hypothetical protein